MTEQQTTTTDVPHDRYHKTSRSVYNSQQEVADAWAEGAFPVKNYNPENGDKAVELDCSANFRGVQQADGHGQLYHYRTLEAIRTRNGLIINNQQCWSRGFAHCSTPRNVDHALPVDAIRNMLRDHNVTADGSRPLDIYDIRAVTGQRDAGRKVIFNTDADFQIFVGRDSTARDADAYIMALTGDETDIEPGKVEKELLRPEKVKDADMPVVGADEYTKTRFRDPSEETIQAEGLEHITDSWRDHYRNHKLYRAELRGDVIVRHGEWFFIPRPGFKPGHGDKPSEPCDGADLGNHQVVREDGCWRTGDALHVRGMVKHRHGDHNAINLGDVWHEAATHDRDAVTVEFGNGGARAD